MTITITEKCPQCGGDGVRSLPDASQQPPVFHEIPCTTCNSTGILNSFELDSTTIDDIFDKVKKIKKTVEDIWDKVNV